MRALKVLTLLFIEAHTHPVLFLILISTHCGALGGRCQDDYDTDLILLSVRELMLGESQERTFSER